MQVASFSKRKANFRHLHSRGSACFYNNKAYLGHFPFALKFRKLISCTHQFLSNESFINVSDILSCILNSNMQLITQIKIIFLKTVKLGNMCLIFIRNNINISFQYMHQSCFMKINKTMIVLKTNFIPIHILLF